jgi:spore coat protein CotF
MHYKGPANVCKTWEEIYNLIVQKGWPRPYNLL